MTYEDWIQKLRTAYIKSLCIGPIRRFLYQFPNGEELFEEYNLITRQVQRRGWRTKYNNIGRWNMEVGEIPTMNDNFYGAFSENQIIENDGTACFVNKNRTVSSLGPVVIKTIKEYEIKWRVFNLPCSTHLREYEVMASPELLQIIVTNADHSVYLEIMVMELIKCGMYPVQENITVIYDFNTLVISYRKPDLLREMEEQILIMLEEIAYEVEHEELQEDLY